MFAATASRTRRGTFAVSAVAALTGLILLAAWGRSLPFANSHDPIRPVPAGPAARPAEHPPAKLVVDPPPTDALARGVAIVQFRTENLRVLPVFGPVAVNVSPRLGHLHVTLDDAPWHWAHTSIDPVIVAHLTPGPHKILIELADANHEVLAKEVVRFEVPRAPAGDVPAPEKQKPSADAAFLTKAVPGIAASVKIIEYAAKHASDEKVRHFAGHVAKQHKESVDTATGHARRLNIAVVTDPDKDSKAMLDKLSRLKGTDLDFAFLEWLSDIHTDVTVFEAEIKNGTDAALKTYARNSILAGDGHLKEARELLATLKK